MTDLFRSKGIDTLSLLIKKESNVKIIEKLVFSLSKGCEKDYNRILFQTAITLKKSGLKEAHEALTKGRVCWNDKVYGKVSEKMNELNSYLVHPFIVEEGVLTCHKCNSKRTFATQIQTRSSDESISVFIRCSECSHRWVNN